MGEGLDELWVGVEEADAIDDGRFEEEASDGSRRREVVRHRAVVDSYCCFHS